MIQPWRSTRVALRLLACALLAAPLLPPATAAVSAAPAALSAPSRPSPADAASERAVAYPAGTTAWILHYTFVLGGGLLFLMLLNAAGTWRANRSAADSLAQECRRLRQVTIGYPEGMTFLEELHGRRLLEQRLGPLGVTVLWKSFPSASTLLAALSDGAVDFCGGGGTASVFAQAAGQVFVRVAREKVPDLQAEAILVREDSAIRSLRDLKGCTVGFDEGSSAHYVLVRALQIVGLSYADIHPRPLSQGEALPLFERGDLDAWVVWMPYAATDARRRYPGRSLADLHSILGDSAAEEVPTLYYATPELVRDYPRTLKAILEEVNEAGVQYNQQLLEQAEARIAAAGDRADLPDEELLQLLRQRVLERAILPLDDPSLRSLQAQADLLHDQGLLPERVPVRDGTYSLRTRQNWTY